DSIQIALAFVENNNGWYQFDLYVNNKNNTSFLVSPEKCFYTAKIKDHSVTTKIDRAGAEWVPVDDTLFTIHYDTVFAMNPETEILETRKQISRENSNYESNKSNQALTAMLNLASDITRTIKGEKETRGEKNQELRGKLNEYENENQHLINMNSLNENLSNFQLNTIRKTTLPGNYSLWGSIRFPITKNVSRLTIHIVIGDYDQEFSFSQERLKTN
ncbi:MAG TPA: hypothetical protein VJ954_03340, partial [Ignavibacteriaceae bacterium]|nr:hypothetical protein [Ignavibacteriaceae bacterium]